MFCTKCGTKIEENMQFCFKCGAKVSGISEPKVEVVIENEKVEISQENSGLTQNLIYATFIERVIAFIIDIFVMTLLMMPVIFLIGESSLLNLIRVFLPIFYFSFFESSNNMGTIGKRIMGIKVVDLHGDKLHFGRALLRNLGRFVSGLIFMIGYLMMIWTKKSQTLHDKIAETIVLKK